MQKVFIDIIGKNTAIYDNSVVSFLNSYLNLIEKCNVKIILFSKKYKEKDLKRKNELAKK